MTTNLSVELKWKLMLFLTVQLVTKYVTSQPTNMLHMQLPIFCSGV